LHTEEKKNSTYGNSPALLSPGKKIVLMQFTLLILVLLGSLTNSNYLVLEHVYLSKTILPQTHAQVDQNDSNPLVGMNMRGYYTGMSQTRDVEFYFPSDYYEESFKIFSQSGIEFIRYLFFWESYEKDPFSFLNEIKTVSSTADKWGIKVIYANDQYDTSSWLGPKTGTGFPSLLFESNPEYKYGTGGGIGQKDIIAKKWWASWFNRDIRDKHGNDGWILQAEFLKKIVNIVDAHKSTLGYEILNEPHVHDVTQWTKIGRYNSFMTDELRTLTPKTIFFDRQVPSELDGEIHANPENMAKMAPANKQNVIFKATIFGLPYDSSYAESRLHHYAKAAQLAGVPLCICEFNLRSYDRYEVGEHENVTMNQVNVDLIVGKINELNVWGWAVWLWNLKDHTNPNYDFIDFVEDRIYTTPNFDYVKNSISKFKVQESRDTMSPVLSINLPKTVPSEGPLYLQGYAFDIGSGLRSVQVHTNDGEYIDVIPRKYEGIWNWTATLPLDSSKHNIVIGLAVDNRGNKDYTTRPLIFSHQ
jgi:hypothetical protein